MTQPPFKRLFSMSAFEGLRILRKHLQLRPDATFDTIIGIVHKVEPDATTYDLDASLELHRIVEAHVNPLQIEFYRSCVRAVVLVEMPTWAKLMTQGRGRFIKRLKGDEYRDTRSVFREAKLLDEPATDGDIEWWDDIQGQVRLHGDRKRLRQAREAERLSLEYERSRLKKEGIGAEPRWTAIEDNTAGYDVLSYEQGQFGLINRLIEVKSTIASPLRFIVSRNEWDNADQIGNAYLFHIWDMDKNPPILHIRTVEQVRPHIPADNQKGKWKNAQIPVGI